MNKTKAKIITTSIALLGIVIFVLVLILQDNDTEVVPEIDVKWEDLLESLDDETPIEDQLTEEELLELQKYMMGGYDEIPEGAHGGVVSEFNYDPNKKYDFEE